MSEGIAEGRFRAALAQEQPLQIIGVINAYCALLAEQAGFKALYLSGAGVANASFGLPDLAMTSYDQVCEEARRITAASELPLLVDIDSGFGGLFMLARCIKALERAQVAAVHLEDQVQEKRCGHRPNKRCVPTEQMCARIEVAVEARCQDLFIIARTDALAAEGLSAAIERAQAYVAAGADGLFAEAVTDSADYQTICQAVSVPVLANITEFGRTPLLSVTQLQQAGVAMALYPLSAFRAMAKAAATVYQQIRQHGSNAELLDQMQSRAELYQTLDYRSYEDKLDNWLATRSDDDEQ